MGIGKRCLLEPCTSTIVKDSIDVSNVPFVQCINYRIRHSRQPIKRVPNFRMVKLRKSSFNINNKIGLGGPFVR